MMMREARQWAALLLAGSALTACGGDVAIPPDNAANAVDAPDNEMDMDMNELDAMRESAEEALENAMYMNAIHTNLTDTIGAPASADDLRAQPPDPPVVPPPPPPPR